MAPRCRTLVVASSSPARAPRQPAQQENVLNVGKYTQLGSYDPHAGALDTLWWTGNNFYESLLDLNDDLSGPRPVLATAWTRRQRRQDVHVQAAEGVKFNDGTPFDSAAVKLSVERAQALKKAAFLYVKPIAKVETPSPSTVVFHLEQPNNTFLPGLRFLLVVSPKALKTRQGRTTRPRAGCATTRPAPDPTCSRSGSPTSSTSARRTRTTGAAGRPTSSPRSTCATSTSPRPSGSWSRRASSTRRRTSPRTRCPRSSGIRPSPCTRSSARASW